MTTASQQITVIGNVGFDAQLKHTQAKTSVEKIYDPIVDDLVEKTITVEAKPFVIFSIAENRNTPSGVTTIWYGVTSWNPNDQVKSLKKGDRVSVRGDFSKRTFADNNTGAERTELRLRLAELLVLHTKSEKQPHAEVVEA